MPTPGPRRSLEDVEDELGRLKELLDAYRENDGKAELAEDIIAQASTCPPARAIGCLALVHGPVEAASRLLMAVADFSVNAALILSVTFGYCFEAPQAVEKSEKAYMMPLFCSLIYASVFAHISTITLMIFVNTGLNAWGREADLLAMLWRGGHHVWNMLMVSFTLGLLLAMAAATVAIYAKTENGLYFLVWLGGFLVLVWGMWPGQCLYMGTVADFHFLQRMGMLLSRPPSAKSCKHSVMFMSQREQMLAAGKKTADFLDVPFEVLRKQAKLSETLNDDAWRQKELGLVESAEAAPAAPAVSSPVRNALDAVEPGFGEKYAAKFEEQCLEVGQLPKLETSDLVSLLGVPLGHALKIKEYFGRSAKC